MTGTIHDRSALRADPRILLLVNPPGTLIRWRLFHRIGVSMAGDDGGSAGHKRIYQDLVRLGERVLDVQFQTALDRFDRTDRLVRLGVATLAGMVVVLGFFLT